MTKRFRFNTIALFTRNNRPIVDFYTKVLGFTTDWDGLQPNVEMELDGMRILLFPRADFEKMVSRSFTYPETINGTMEISLDVPCFSDVDKEFNNAVTKGAEPVLDPTTKPWGQRTCYISDPDGNLIEISSFNKCSRTIETERLILRPWLESDAGSLFKYASDPDVGPRAGWPPHISIEESLETIRSIFSGEGMWAVELKESGEAIGCVGYLPASLSNLDIQENQCEVGYWIGKPHWGKGICTEAMSAIVDYCFNVKGFSVLWGDYFPENPASGRVMEKCGFVDTGKQVICPNLEIGYDKPVKIMRLENFIVQ